MMYRSFVDLVFIVLCALAVILERSVELRGLRADLADVGEGGTAEIATEDMEPLVVCEDRVQAAGRDFPGVPAALSAIPPGAAVVVVPAGESVSHQRVIAAWWEVRRTGRHAELGVRAVSEGAGT